jgi:hypothetical protein
MGKGSGDCDRPGISLEASDSAKIESTLSEAGVDTTLELQRSERRWWTKDYRVSYRKRKEGWTVFSYSEPIWKAFREYGITSSIEGEPTYFPSLQMARQSVNDVSLEAGLNIDSGLARGKFITYKIGDSPLSITREADHWQMYVHASVLPPNLEKYFNNMKEFNGTWYATGLSTTRYPTRKAARQAVTNWLAQTIIEGK